MTVIEFKEICEERGRDEESIIKDTCPDEVGYTGNVPPTDIYSCSLHGIYCVMCWGRATKENNDG